MPQVFQFGRSKESWKHLRQNPLTKPVVDRQTPNGMDLDSAKLSSIRLLKTYRFVSISIDRVEKRLATKATFNRIKSKLRKKWSPGKPHAREHKQLHKDGQFCRPVQISQ